MSGAANRLPQAPRVRPRNPLQVARELLGSTLREDSLGRFALRQDGIWRPVTSAQVIAAAEAVQQRQYGLDVLRRARAVLGARLQVVFLSDGRRGLLLDGRVASLARVAEAGRQVDRSGWPPEPGPLIYPFGGGR